MRQRRRRKTRGSDLGITAAAAKEMPPFYPPLTSWTPTQARRRPGWCCGVRELACALRIGCRPVSGSQESAHPGSVATRENRTSAGSREGPGSSALAPRERGAARACPAPPSAGCQGARWGLPGPGRRDPGRGHLQIAGAWEGGAPAPTPNLPAPRVCERAAARPADPERAPGTGRAAGATAPPSGGRGRFPGRGLLSPSGIPAKRFNWAAGQTKSGGQVRSYKVRRPRTVKVPWNRMLRPKVTHAD